MFRIFRFRISNAPSRLEFSLIVFNQVCRGLFLFLSLAMLLVLFGCGKSKEAAKQELAGLNLQPAGDDFVKSVNTADMKAIPLFVQAGIDVNVVASNGYTALMTTAENGRADLAKWLLSHGATPDIQGKDGLTALMLAADNNHPDMIKLLIAAKANVPLQDHSGWSAMMKAVYQGNTACAQLLADKSKEDLDRALLVAALTGHSDTAKMLIDYGAEVDFKSDDGKTALMYAASKGSQDLVAMLLKAGADPSLADRSGQTAESIASAKGFSDIATAIHQTPAPGGNKATVMNSPVAAAAVQPNGSPITSPSTPVNDKDFLNQPQETVASSGGVVGTPSASAGASASTPGMPGNGASLNNNPSVASAGSSGASGNAASNAAGGVANSASGNGSAMSGDIDESLSKKVSVTEIQQNFLPVQLLEVHGHSAKVQTDQGETYSVQEGDSLHGLDYRVVAVESRNIDDKDGNLVDASVVKLKKEGDASTVSLVKGMPARAKGAFVILNFSGQTQKVDLDQEFKMPSEPDHTYKIVDIRPTQVVIRRLEDDQVWTLDKN
jgi:ankyrin repeat protein